MANPYYNYDGAFIPGQLARAEAVAAEFTAVQVGFSLLSYDGTDSGAANAYVITTSGAPTGAYSNGQILTFQAANTCTGASTIRANGLPVVPLTRFDGSPTQSNDVLANGFYIARYDAAGSKFRILAPTAFTAATGSISGSAPTHKVGLTAAAGVSTAAAPIDATFAIDTAISPTWTGTHTFSTAIAAGSGGTGISSYTVGDLLVANGTASLTKLSDVATGSFLRSGGVGAAPSYGAIVAADIQTLSPTWSGTHTFSNAITVNGAGSTLKGGVTISVPAGGTTLTANVISGATGVAFGKTKIGDDVLATGADLFSTTDVMSIGTTGAAATNFYTNGTARIQIGSAGNVTFNAPSSGTSAAINGASGSYAALVTAGGSAGTQKGFSVVTTTQNAADRLINANNSVSNLLDIFGDGHGTLGPTLTWNSAGAIVINAPTSGESLTIGAAAGADCLNLLGNSGTSNSFGLAVQAGTTSSDYAISARNRAATQTYFLVRGDGDVQAIDQGGSLQDVGWRDMPQTLQNSSYSFALSDRGKEIYTTTSGVTYTIPANGSVAFPVGSTIVVINDSGGNIFLQITTDTLAWFQGGATSVGNRIIAAGSIVTIVKVSSTRWALTGSGIS